MSKCSSIGEALEAARKIQLRAAAAGQRNTRQPRSLQHHDWKRGVLIHGYLAIHHYLAQDSVAGD
jgi:hypothetical protein